MSCITSIPETSKCVEYNQKVKVKVKFDNKEFYPENWSITQDNISFEDQYQIRETDTNLNIILSYHEFCMFSKFIENYAIISALKQSKKYTRKKRKKILSKFVQQLGINFSRLNSVKNMGKNNILENPYQIIKVNNQNALITNFERLFFANKETEYSFVCLLNYR